MVLGDYACEDPAVDLVLTGDNGSAACGKWRTPLLVTR